MPAAPRTDALTIQRNGTKHIVRHRTPDGMQFPLAWTVTTYCNTEISGVTEINPNSTTSGSMCPVCLAHQQYAIQRTRGESHAAQ